jgi:hypothetical protein
MSSTVAAPTHILRQVITKGCTALAHRIKTGVIENKPTAIPTYSSPIQLSCVLLLDKPFKPSPLRLCADLAYNVHEAKPPSLACVFTDAG